MNLYQIYLAHILTVNHDIAYLYPFIHVVSVLANSKCDLINTLQGSRRQNPLKT